MVSSFISSPLPYIALLIAHLIWGGNFVVAKITLEEFPPASLALFRFAFASLLLAPFFFANSKKSHLDKKDFPKLILVGILMITLNITFFFEGIKRTTAINASVLTLVIPSISVLLGWIMLREKIYLLNLFGILLGLIGAVVIIGLPAILQGNFSPEMMLGNLLIILACLVWVLGAVFSKELLKKYSSLTVTAVIFMVGTITFLIPALKEYLVDPSWPQQITFLGFLGLLYMTFLSSVSAYFLFEWGLFRLGVIKADLLQYIEPFVASSLAIFILGETLSPTFLAGTLLIVVGVYLGTLAKEIHHRHKFHRH